MFTKSRMANIWSKADEFDTHIISIMTIIFWSRFFKDLSRNNDRWILLDERAGRLYWFSGDGYSVPEKIAVIGRWGKGSSMWRGTRRKKWKWLIFRVHECVKTGNCRRTGYWGDFSGSTTLFPVYVNRTWREYRIRTASFYHENRVKDKGEWLRPK